MNFLSSDLGYLSPGTVVEVTLAGTEANVLLLDSSNLHSYRARRQYTYYGGHYRQSPVRIRVHSSGTWHVVVDLGGGVGDVRASVKVLNAV